MSTNINDPAYSTLSTYAVLSYDPVASANITTITNGYFGSVVPTLDIGNLDPDSNLNNVDAGTGISELATLVSAINAVTPQTVISTITPISSIQTYTPGSYKSTSSIDFETGSGVILDAEGNNDAQFFIITDSNITFNNFLGIFLIRGARNCNVFWLAGGDITFTSNSLLPFIPCIFIAGGSIALQNNPIILGRLYSQGGSGIGFSGISFVDATCGEPPIPPVPPIPIPISNICFLGNTPVQTDQGIISMKNIHPSIHTIHNEKIVAITQSVSVDEYLVCFEKNALGENYPSRQTVMSKNHKINYKGKMIKAYKFTKFFRNVYKVTYNGEILYNVLMEKHRIMNINHLMCETLDPNNIVSKLYTSDSIPNKSEYVKEMNHLIVSNLKKEQNLKQFKQITTIYRR
jgi:hypothetical protein